MREGNPSIAGRLRAGEKAVEDAAVAEVAGRHLIPAAEHFFDRNERYARKLVTRQHRRVTHAIEAGGENLLPRLAEQKLEIRGGDLPRTATIHYLVDHGDREI